MMTSDADGGERWMDEGSRCSPHDDDVIIINSFNFSVRMSDMK